MFKSPFIKMYGEDEILISSIQFNSEEEFVAFLRNKSGVKKIQVGVAYEWDVLTGVKRKVKDVKDSDLLDMLMHVKQIDIYKGTNYAFGWIAEPKWLIQESLYK